MPDNVEQLPDIGVRLPREQWFAVVMKLSNRPLSTEQANNLALAEQAIAETLSKNGAAGKYKRPAFSAD